MQGKAQELLVQIGFVRSFEQGLFFNRNSSGAGCLDELFEDVIRVLVLDIQALDRSVG